MNITPIEIQPPTAEDKQNIMSLQRYAQRNGFQHFHRHLLDITGAMHGFSHPVERMADVLGFDGSSLSGYKAIQGRRSCRRAPSLIAPTMFLNCACKPPSMILLPNKGII